MPAQSPTSRCGSTATANTGRRSSTLWRSTSSRWTSMRPGPIRIRRTLINYSQTPQGQGEVEPEPVEDYRFRTLEGETVLSELFGDKPELFVIHNMGKGCSA